jgi:fibronectin-binding autotransporter adhesin
MKFVLFILATLAAYTSLALDRVWINTAGGDWSVTNNWSPPGPPATGDNVLITNNGTYTVTILTNLTTVGRLILGGTSGTQTLLAGISTVLSVTNAGTVLANGILTVTNGGLQGDWLITSGAQLNLSGAAGKFLYSSAITNQGTVNWSGGSLSVGGSSFATTFITNSGLWLMTGDYAADYGGGTPPTFYNSGTIRKTTTTGTSTFDEMDLVNLKSGIVDIESGTFTLDPITTNYVGGSFTMAASAAINFTGGNWTDAGGVISGGTIPFNGSSFYLRTNIIAGIKLIAGNIYINTNTFQQAGAITNLTLDGVVLEGTNSVAGTLTINSGSVPGKLTVLPPGQLVLATEGSKLLYGMNLINQGTVLWTGGELAVGGTPTTVISNGGSWLLSSDDQMAWGGGNTPSFNNFGTFRKTAGASGSSSSFSFVAVVNESNALMQVDAGTLALPSGYTNYAGTLRLNGGQLAAAGGITVNGGTLDGSGIMQQSALIGGIISPGQGGPGTIGFSSGLNLGSNATLIIDGISSSQYDQLLVTGAVSLANCTLQVNSLPSVPVGTTFTIINNDGTDPVSGTFNGLAENSLLNVGGQSFRIHYAGGTGNDVTLVRASGAAGPQLSATGGSYSNNVFQFTGTGGSSLVFTIQASTNFIQWTNIGTATSAVSGGFNFIDTNAPKFHYRFYRTTN